MMITPELAKAWLATSVDQNYRRLKLRHVARLAGDMKDGRWDLNGECVKLNHRNEVVDGQHRLAACIRANRPFESFVAWGIENTINIDVGSRRSIRDLLTSRGEQNTTDLSGILFWLWRYRNYANRRETGGTPYSLQNIATFDQLLDILDAFPGVRHSGVLSRRTRNQGQIGSGSILGGVHAVASLYDPDAADKYMDAITYGTGLAKHDSVYWLRERLIADKSSKTKGKLPPVERSALAIKAWNAWIQGRTVTNLRWRATGPTPEPFPVIQDADEQEIVLAKVPTLVRATA